VRLSASLTPFANGTVLKALAAPRVNVTIGLTHGISRAAQLRQFRRQRVHFGSL